MNFTNLIIQIAHLRIECPLLGVYRIQLVGIVTQRVHFGLDCVTRLLVSVQRLLDVFIGSRVVVELLLELVDLLNIVVQPNRFEFDPFQRAN